MTWHLHLPHLAHPEATYTEMVRVPEIERQIVLDTLSKLHSQSESKGHTE